MLGYNRASDIFLAEELHALGVTVRLLTADGSAGTCGLVTDGMEGVNYTHLYTCGPEADAPRRVAALPHRWAVQL